MPHQALVRTSETGFGELQVKVSERRDIPGAWAVEAINIDGDGEVYMAVFSGPDARGRAEEYASMKYGDSRASQ